MDNYYNPGCNRQSSIICPSYSEATPCYGCMAYYHQPLLFNKLNALNVLNSRQIDFLQSRKRKRETEHRGLKDFFVRTVLEMTDEDSSTCSSASLSCQYANEEPNRLLMANYRTTDMPAKVQILSRSSTGTVDFFTPPKPASLSFSSSSAEDYFSRYYEPVSPVSAETFVSSTDDAYAPSELDNPCLPTRSANPQSPTYSCRNSDDSSPNAKKYKRVRTIFTPQQLEKLEQEFGKTQYMVGAARVELAAELKLTESQVKVWFQNRRIKERKHNMDVQKATLSKLKEDEDYSSRSS